MDFRSISLLALASITLLVGCEAQLVCEVCTSEHSTESHVRDAASTTGGTPESDAMFSDDVLLAFVARHRDDGFIRVNAAPYDSDVSDSKLNVFVSEFALPEYLETLPDEAESDGMIPRGSFVVRELVDHTGEVTKLTALYRGPKGYNPASGDFWFAVTDPSGRVVTDMEGAPMAGPLESCSSCHAGRASADYLFGVPGEARFSEFGKPTQEATEPTQPAEDPDEPTEEPMDPTQEERNEPVEPAEPVQEPNEPTPAPTIDLSGWTIANLEADLSREQKAILENVSARSGVNIVIGRDATRAEFEAYWGPLPSDTVYVDQGQSSGFGAPIVNGEETWVLRDLDGNVIDGPTPVGAAEASYKRGSSTGNWIEHLPDEATPGTVSVALPEGVWITEWSDAGDYHVEFIELAIR